MRIKTVKGHLTATEKRAIAAIINAGLTIGKVNRKTYSVAKHDSGYSVMIVQNETDFFSGKIAAKSYFAEFVLK